MALFGKKSKSSFVAVVFLFRPDLCDICRCAAFCTVQGAFGKYCLSENSPAKYLAAMLKNENPYSFHLWYLQTLFLFTAVTFLKDKFLSEKYARRAAILLILALPAFYTLFCRDWVWVFKGFFQKYLFSCSGRCLYGKRWKRRLEFWQQWERAVSQRWCWKFAFAGRDL